MNATPELKEEIREQLTYRIPSYREHDPPTIIENMGVFKDDIITLPSGRVDLIPKGYEIVDKRVLVPASFPPTDIKLRESQQEVYDEIEGDAIINASVSWGKTFSSLAIAGKFKQKTLVVVHTLQLRRQWEKEVESMYGFKPDVIGSSKFGIDTPIVVSNVQTVHKHIDKLRKEFGTLILDEMHHVSSNTFSNVIDRSAARYKIGLTGTLERKDGKHVVFRDYFGNKIFKPKKENYMKPSVDIIDTKIPLMDGQFIPWPTKINKLVSNPMYLELVSAVAATYAEMGHKVLVVGDRVDFLEACARAVGDNAVAITGNIEDLDEREKLLKRIEKDKDIIFGTQSIFSEGISINSLSCLVLAAPLNNEPLLTQLIGRVVRLHPNKLQPKVVDIHLTGNTARRQANTRTGHYLKHGYKIKKF